MGDPGQGMCKKVCCPWTKESKIEIQRLKVDTLMCYDVNKWDLLKTFN